MTREARGSGGRAEGLEAEGGGVRAPSAQAPRGPWGRGRLAAPHAAAAAASSLCLLGPHAVFLGRV